MPTTPSDQHRGLEDGHDWPRVLWFVPVLDHLIGWASYHAGVTSRPRSMAARIVHSDDPDS